jgi:hypothetical protein
MIGQAAAPLAARRGIVAPRDQARILQRDHGLIIVAVERPSLDLSPAALAPVQERVKGMAMVIAFCPDIAQRRL